MVQRSTGSRRTGRFGAAAIVLVLGLVLAACSAKGKVTLAPNTEGTPVQTGLVVNLGKATADFDLTCGIVNGRAVVDGEIKYHDRGATLLNTVPVYGPIKFEGELEVLRVSLTDPVTNEETVVITNAEGCEAYDALNNPAPGYIAQFLGVYRVNKFGKGNAGDSAPINTQDDDDDDDCDDRRGNDDDDDDDEDCDGSGGGGSGGNQGCPNTNREGCFNVLVFDQKGTTPSTILDLTGDAFSLELIGGPYNGYTRAGYVEKGDIKVRD